MDKLQPYSKAYLAKNKVLLPNFRSKAIVKTLFLDMDETLLHCLDDRDPEGEEADVILDFEDEEGD